MRKVVAAIATLLLGAILYGYTLPSTWHVERAITVSATRPQVYPWIATLEKWPAWAMPAGLSPQTSDKSLTWLGGGRIDVTEAIPDTSVAYELRYSDHDHPVHGQLKLSNSTTVTWTDDGEMGHNPIARYFVGSIVRDVGSDMEQGLARLKTLIEKE